MPMTFAEHERKLKAPAVCELLPLRDLPIGDNIMVRTSGAFAAGYEPVSYTHLDVYKRQPVGKSL